MYGRIGQMRKIISKHHQAFLQYVTFAPFKTENLEKSEF